MADTSRRLNGREIAMETMIVIVALTIVTGAAYFWSYLHGSGAAGDAALSQEQQRLAASHPTKEQLAASLQAAQDKLARQVAALSALKADFPSSPALDKHVIQAYAAAAAEIGKTDKFFSSLGKDPVLKSAAADPAAAAAIVALRIRIDADLAAWQATSAGAPNTLALSQAALADLASIQAYFSQLLSYISSMPPSNAFQSDVIIADQGELAAEAAVVNGAVNDIGAIGAPIVIAVASPSPSPSPASQTGGGADLGAGSSNTPESPASSSSPSPSPSPSDSGAPIAQSTVTVADVLAAQQAADQAASQVNYIQQQIVTYDILSSGDTTPPAGPDTGGSSAGTGGSGDQGSGDQGGQSWIPQFLPPPGPSDAPKLIQGDNPFE